MSPQYSLNKEDGLKLVKGLGIAACGAMLTYIASVLPELNLGQYQLILFPLLSSAVHLGLKWYDGEIA